MRSRRAGLALGRLAMCSETQKVSSSDNGESGAGEHGIKYSSSWTCLSERQPLCDVGWPRTNRQSDKVEASAKEQLHLPYHSVNLQQATTRCPLPKPVLVSPSLPRDLRRQGGSSRTAESARTKRGVGC